MRTYHGPCIGCGSFSCFKKNCSREANPQVKLTTKVTGKLGSTNEVMLLKDGAQKKSEMTELPVLRLIANMLDMIAAGEDIFMIIGATSRKDAYTITIKHNGQPTTLYGNSLTELAAQSDTLL